MGIDNKILIWLDVRGVESAVDERIWNKIGLFLAHCNFTLAYSDSVFSLFRKENRTNALLNFGHFILCISNCKTFKNVLSNRSKSYPTYFICFCMCCKRWKVLSRCEVSRSCITIWTVTPTSGRLSTTLCCGVVRTNPFLKTTKCVNCPINVWHQLLLVL